MSELHNNAEAFVLCAVADNTSGNHVVNQETAIFLLSLILAHKKGQLCATQATDYDMVRIRRAVALGG